MKQNVVVRFAPSPTGYLHVGGARTAIFNWLYARKHNGKFVLRIEDTDADRTTDEAIAGIVDGLRWLGLDWDQGPDFQSRHIQEHVAAVGKMVATGHAYPCFCTKDLLDAKREAAQKNKVTYRYDGACRALKQDQVERKMTAGIPHTIRLKVPRGGGSVVFDDAVCGRVEKRFEDLEDFVLVRSDGRPLYVLSNAVDDIRDGVTHIIRGQDGLANTPKQVLIYEALGAPLPVFAHMSLTLDPRKAKISKRRHGEKVAVHYYREKGFLPWAMVNFLVLLGWATTDSKEIFTRDELTAAFDFNGISKTNSVFDLREKDPKFFTDPKLINMNAHYLKTMPLEDLVPYVRQELTAAGLWRSEFDEEPGDRFLQIVELLRSRLSLLTEFATLGSAYFTDDFTIEPELVEKHLHAHPVLKSVLPELGEKIREMDEYAAKPLEKLIVGIAKSGGVKTGVLVNGIRVVLTGQAVGPDFMKMMMVLGQQCVGQRLAAAPECYNQNEESGFP